MPKGQFYSLKIIQRIIEIPKFYQNICATKVKRQQEFYWIVPVIIPENIMQEVTASEKHTSDLRDRGIFESQDLLEAGSIRHWKKNVTGFNVLLQKDTAGDRTQKINRQKHRKQGNPVRRLSKSRQSLPQDCRQKRGKGTFGSPGRLSCEVTEQVRVTGSEKAP